MTNSCENLENVLANKSASVEENLCVLTENNAVVAFR